MQSIDWTVEPYRSAIRRLHIRYVLWQTKFTLIALVCLFVIGAYDTIKHGVWLELWMALTLTGLILVRIFLHLSRLSKANQKIGAVQYTTDDNGLTVRLSEGTFSVPWTKLDTSFASKDGIIVRYSGRSVLTIPNGEIRAELERVLGKAPTPLG
ncbi:YcxB family protein [Aquirhabdus parva]|uniref:YcxB family protein n=1 Tax=Aquirhabdus parva TaxID=2283318 RepID=A0A345P4H7_9GAMM|nr:YcxB family protein [Aquirhabdus parva]AXI02186.1 YcxB family protein [Aquirhabdus parva]